MDTAELPQVTIERTLAQLRWRPADFEEETLLRRIAEHGDYWLLLHDDVPLLAPDDRNRALAAVFTSEAARDAYLAEPGLAPYGTLPQHCDGRQLAAWLSQRGYDGVVFNCLGPDRPLAFVPELLERLLPYELAYLGLIGSQRKILLFRQRLLNKGFSEAQLDRVHAPIGLDIGAETPEEIAIAIAAELVQVRARRRAPRAPAP